MNCLNKLSISAGAEIAIKRVIEVDVEISGTSMALRLTNGRAKVFTLAEVELLEREDLLEPLADLIGPVVISLLATL